MFLFTFICKWKFGNNITKVAKQEDFKIGVSSSSAAGNPRQACKMIPINTLSLSITTH